MTQSVWYHQLSCSSNFFSKIFVWAEPTGMTPQKANWEWSGISWFQVLGPFLGPFSLRGAISKNHGIKLSAAIFTDFVMIPQRHMALTVVYLQVHTACCTYVTFEESRARVAPLRNQTIPRLELLAAVILARLVTAIEGALKCEVPIKKITCCSDSEVVVCWIRGMDKEWKQFVLNRVK